MDIVRSMPSPLNRFRVNSDANCGPLSLRTLRGTPCSFHISSLYIFAIPDDDTSVVVAVNQIILLKQSTITRMASFPFDLGSGPMMSILISSQGPAGMGRGCSSIFCGLVQALFRWQERHPFVYFFTSVHMDGHQ